MKHRSAPCCWGASRPVRAARGTAGDGLHVSLILVVIRTTCQSLVALLLVLPSARALAVEADEYIFLPTVTQGEREIDWHYGTGSSGDTTRAQSNTGIAFGIGVTQHWFTELDVQYRRQSPAGTRFDAIEWENILQIGEPGQWAVDVGMLFNVDRPKGAPNGQNKEGWSIRTGPLLQKDIGRFQVNFNLLLTRFFQGSEAPSTQIGYQSQINYRYSRPLEAGVQMFGRFSGGGQSWAPAYDQVQRVGPVILGRFGLPRERSLSYNLAFLMGTTSHSPENTLRLQLEYEF